MLIAPAVRAPRAGLTRYYATRAHSVAVLGKFDPDADHTVLLLGVARVVVGSVFLAAPVTSARVLGMDTATAKRVTYLARMAAVRDLGLGAGTLAAGSSRAAAPWLVAAAAADTVDAIAIAAALKKGTARGVMAGGVVVGALASAAAGFWAASRLRR